MNNRYAIKDELDLCRSIRKTLIAENEKLAASGDHEAAVKILKVINDCDERIADLFESWMATYQD